MNLPLIIAVAVALLLGALLGWLYESSRASHLRSESAGLSAQLLETRSQVQTARAETERLRKDLSSEQTLRTRAETERQSERANLGEQKRILNEAEAKLREAFQSLAATALQQSNEQFLRLAEERLDNLQQQAAGDLAQRQESIKGLVDPLQQRLTDLQNHLGRLESSRESAYGELRNQVQSLAQTNRELQKETGSLVSTLRQPQVKGRWGELTLRRAVELAGMSIHCDFEEQVSVDTPEGRFRPDLIVHLPGNARVVVDAKVPLHGFLKVAEAQNDAERDAGLADHARLVRAHVNQLSSREYWKQFEPSPDFVVLFVPGESFFSAALEKDPNLLEDAISAHVVLASPANLIAILRAVSYGWKQEQVAESAQEISALGRDLFERLVNFVEHVQDIRGGLERANNSFNKAVGSLETRLLPAARKLKEKGIQSTSELTSIEPTETSLRLLNPAITEGEK
jgi:DNA recombination protein RmuC